MRLFATEYFYDCKNESNITDMATDVSISLTVSLRCIRAWASAILIILSRCLTAIFIPPETSASYLNSV